MRLDFLFNQANDRIRNCTRLAASDRLSGAEKTGQAGKNRRNYSATWVPTSSGPREKSMSDFLIEHTPSAYKYPLLIKHLLHAPMTQSADQEIVYRDLSRYTYRDLRERIGRLASGLTPKGVRRGDVGGVLDWDIHLYLECCFAIAMLGATLQTSAPTTSPRRTPFEVRPLARRPIRSRRS